MQEADRIKQEIVETVKREYRLGMVNMFEGNVSARMGDRIFVTPSQVSKEATTAEMLIEMTLDGQIVHCPEGYRPTTETRMHLEVYRLRPDVRAVIHNHSPFATAFAMNGEPIESRALTEMNMMFGTIPVVPYGTPGTDAICAGFKDVIGNRMAMLLANHGLIVFGPTLELAFSFAEAAEKLARTIFISRLLGKPVDLPEQEIAMLRENGSRGRDKAIKAMLSPEQ